ncbi:sensor domain-containing protein [Nonomuraea glycinis]|uniref:PknH-like extracellular domain-containing protein n=1 Tax=Nonomuraea glycinis TaxID=2047744 RepID=A0A918AEX2_9ACTN|nr:sensor domain-containing protein [Nonomuraea glycinis]MCA2182713.1 sensor domain-containing protein [Nonomuraea glycinis]GGP17331.1 hypothetical protein GCM10012278_84840 [Nonomuraea glycinis]
MASLLALTATATPALAIRGEIPRGFLLYEHKTIGDLKVGRTGRVAARTVELSRQETTGLKEQVILYSTPAMAQRALREFKAAWKRCGHRKGFAQTLTEASAGEESRRTFTTRDGGVEDDEAIITRTANAVYVYLRPPTKTSVKPLLRDSRAMTAKICDIADCVDLVGAR